MVSSGKSRTTGWTRAEYDRPVSLRSRASWIPARKSCASRIIGDRAVRPIAVSTSRSIDASVPFTISRRIGSVGTGHHQVAEIVDPGGEARMQWNGRAVLLDDGRSG